VRVFRPRHGALEKETLPFFAFFSLTLSFLLSCFPSFLLSLLSMSSGFPISGSGEKEKIELKMFTRPSVKVTRKRENERYRLMNLSRRKNRNRKRKTFLDEFRKVKRKEKTENRKQKRKKHTVIELNESN
jgi:hypothetical protein